MNEQEQQKKPSNAERLTDLLKFDPIKRHPITQEVFADVLKEITEERLKTVRVQAKETLQKAMELRQQMNKAEKDFKGQQQKFEKELGKLLNQVQSMLSGKEPEPEQTQPQVEESAA